MQKRKYVYLITNHKKIITMNTEEKNAKAENQAVVMSGFYTDGIDHSGLEVNSEQFPENEKGITIVTNNQEIKDIIRSEWLLKNEIVEPLITVTENYFEKPKSKYHK